AFLGMGLLGANFVRAMINRGEKVQVWNRTAAKATALEQYGALATGTPAEAVKGAERIHLTLKDDVSVDEVLAIAAPGLRPGAAIIDHTTTSVEGAIRRTNEWKSRGFIYLHAPVFMGPPNALESTGYMLVSGDQQVVEQFTPILAKMTGKLLNFGPETGRAAAMKLLGNLFLVAFTTGIADTLMLAKGMQVPVSDLAMLFDNWNPAVLLPSRLKRMTSGNYSSPSWELSMARKDTGLFLQEAKKGGVTLAVIPAVAAEMDRWIAKGHGGDDWTVIAKGSV
ncbi:MAG TPA: NAD(P)-dependent oxidoreductase, partial [Puia sp.]|nr:NAD(P)-dependent oxidoreductase [Puia sp.]